MAIKDDVRARIYDAADKLLAESPDGSIPTVDSVRQLSQANMNAVVEGMKDWRAKQRKQVQVIKEPLPSDLAALVQSAGQSLWESAQFLANESLNAARVAFEAEKSDLLQLSQEQTASFELVSQQLVNATERLAVEGRLSEERTLEIQSLEAAAGELHDEIARTQKDLAVALERATEVSNRADELRQELDRAHNEGAALRAAADAAVKRSEAAEARSDAARSALDQATETIAKLREDLATAKGATNTATEEAKRSASLLSRAEGEQEKARLLASTAREEAATLRGQLDTTNQVAATAREETAALLIQLDTLKGQLIKLGAASESEKTPATATAPAKSRKTRKA